MLTVEQVKQWVSSLSNSQGLYGRIYRDLSDNDNWESFVDILNQEKVKDQLDMILLIEQ